MADHTVALTHQTVAEHLYAAGFEPFKVYARVLPYTFTGRLPSSGPLVRAYLHLKPTWQILGKHF